MPAGPSRDPPIRRHRRREAEPPAAGRPSRSDGGRSGADPDRAHDPPRPIPYGRDPAGRPLAPRPPVPRAPCGGRERGADAECPGGITRCPGEGSERRLPRGAGSAWGRVRREGGPRAGSSARSPILRSHTKASWRRWVGSRRSSSRVKGPPSGARIRGRGRAAPVRKGVPTGTRSRAAGEFRVRAEGLHFRWGNHRARFQFRAGEHSPGSRDSPSPPRSRFRAGRASPIRSVPTRPAWVRPCGRAGRRGTSARGAPVGSPEPAGGRTARGAAGGSPWGWTPDRRKGALSRAPPAPGPGGRKRA